MSQQPYEVRSAEVTSCPRCGRQGLLSARVPHSTWSDGTPLGAPSHMTIVLCRVCDMASPEAAALIAFLTVHEEVTVAEVDEFGRLIQAWTSVARPPAPDMALLEEEQQLWERGEL